MSCPSNTSTRAHAPHNSLSALISISSVEPRPVDCTTAILGRRGQASRFWAPLTKSGKDKSKGRAMAKAGTVSADSSSVLTDYWGLTDGRIELV
jgi:hypothetical protein